MIDWLRLRLQQNPDAVIARSELEDALNGEFALAVENGLLRPLPIETDGLYVDRRTGRVYSLAERDGRIYGWNEDEPDEMPIEVSASDLACYAVDPVRFAEKFGLAPPATSTNHAASREPDLRRSDQERYRSAWRLMTPLRKMHWPNTRIAQHLKQNNPQLRVSDRETVARVIRYGEAGLFDL